MTAPPAYDSDPDDPVEIWMPFLWSTAGSSVLSMPLLWTARDDLSSSVNSTPCCACGACGQSPTPALAMTGGSPPRQTDVGRIPLRPSG